MIGMKLKVSLILLVNLLCTGILSSGSTSVVSKAHHVTAIRANLRDRMELHRVLERMSSVSAKNQAIFQVLTDDPLPDYFAFDVLLKHISWHYDSDLPEPPRFIPAIVSKGYCDHFGRLCQDEQIFAKWILPDITGKKPIGPGPGLVFLTDSPSMIKAIAEHGGNLSIKDSNGYSALMRQLQADVTADARNLSPKTVALILYGAKTGDEYTFLFNTGKRFLTEYFLDLLHYKRDLEEGLKTFLRLRHNPQENYVHYLPRETQTAVINSLIREIDRKKEELLCEFC